MKRLLACLVALVMTLLPCAAMAEEYALYASEHGYTWMLLTKYRTYCRMFYRKPARTACGDWRE